jgi:hypothetical protein
MQLATNDAALYEIEASFLSLVSLPWPVAFGAATVWCPDMIFWKVGNDVARHQVLACLGDGSLHDVYSFNISNDQPSQYVTPVLAPLIGDAVLHFLPMRARP